MVTTGMRHVFTEFLTTDDASPEFYGDVGTCLNGMKNFPTILRHVKYDDDCWHEVQLFARDPEVSAQIWLSIYPEPIGTPALCEQLKFYRGQQSDFRLLTSTKFEVKELVPKTAAFDVVLPFCVRDNERLRIVQALRGKHRSILVVASRSDSSFLESNFLRITIGGLSLADVPLDAPFC